ncbi:hypothetical protein G6F22_008448 [Rhizopus arrhizus]|nr:hypothetical protein G6F23_010212 [Rhizopus arrhizus]KAG0784059.1 hypothetical protein G6F22_008448 [Rhizopus arrhizus]
MQKTADIRKSLPQEHSLFLTYLQDDKQDEESKSAAPSTIANWIKTHMKKAGINEAYKPHSIRSAVSTKAVMLGNSIEKVKDHANWSQASNTFEKYYYKPTMKQHSSTKIQNSIFAAENNTTSESEAKATRIVLGTSNNTTVAEAKDEEVLGANTETMSDSDALIVNCLKHNSKPTFNGFATRHLKSIQEASVLLNDVNSASQLQRFWINIYNKNAQIQRPRTKLFKMPKKASQNFLLIHKMTKLQRELNLKFEIGKLSVRNEILDTVIEVNDEEIDDESISDNNDVQEHETAQIGQVEVEQNIQNVEEEQNVEERNVQDEPNSQVGSDQDDINTSLSCLFKRKSMCSDDELFKKLLDSSCINLANDGSKEKFAQLLPTHIYEDLLAKCQKEKQEFESSLPPKLKKIINDIFDDLSTFIFDNTMDRILDFIDTRKAEETNKSCEAYKLLSTIDAILKNMKHYKRETKLSESFYLHAFLSALRPLLDDTRVILKEGEPVSAATQRMQLINEVDITYGRRVDILVATDLDTDIDDVEICSIEFKKPNATTATLLQQQNKNIRINGCILNDIHLFTQNTDHQLFYLDFAGKSAYIVQLFRYENYFVGHKVGNFSLISSLVELHQLRKSVLNLYAWREFAVELSNKITLSHIEQSYKYDLVEVSDYASNNFVQSPKRNVTPVNIFLSPSNQSKRTKYMTDQS